VSNAVQEQLRQVTGLPVSGIRSMEEIVSRSIPRQRFNMLLMTVFGSAALFLAGIGIYGLMAYSVQQRIRDFGVRRALGATSGDVMRLVVGSAIKVIAAGAVIGLVLAAAFGRLISTMLFGVQPLDFLTFALVTIVLAFTAALSIAGPAWRAARIDPAQALRTK